MNLPDILNVAIGLVLLYFLLSTIASLLVELLTAWSRYREEILQVTVNRLLIGRPDQPWWLGTLMYDRAVATLLPASGPAKSIGEWLRPAAGAGATAADAAGRDVIARFWGHPKIRSLVPQGAEAPPTLAAATFAQVLIDITVPKDAQGELPDSRLALERALLVPRADTPESLLATLHGLALTSEIPSGATGEALWRPFRAGLAAWFDEAARQATQVYRGRMRWLLLVTGFALAVAFNADSVRVIRVLSHDGSLREAAAAYATTLAAEQQMAPAADGEAAREIRQTRAELGAQVRNLREVVDLGFPLGWTAAEWAEIRRGGASEAAPVSLPGLGWAVFLKLLGFLATGLAVAQGGPFWYDLMQKLVGLRRGAAAPAVDEKGGPAPAAAATDGRVVPATPLPLEIGYDLTAPGTGFSARKAYWLASASVAAYAPADEARTLLTRSWHFHRFEPFEDDASGAYGYLAADEKVVVVAFRGTELQDFRDMLVNAQFKWSAIADGLNHRVHAGFLSSFVSLEKKVEAALRTALTAPGRGARAGSAPPPRQLYLTGHSLGGALATVMFARLTLLRAAAGSTAMPVPALYTFGCPRVGDGSFSKALDSAYPERIFRVVNDVDIIPELPPFPDYHHAGRLMFFEPNGELRTQVSGLSRVLLQTSSALDAATIKQVGAEKFAAHGVANYVERCEKLARARN